MKTPIETFNAASQPTSLASVGSESTTSWFRSRWLRISWGLIIVATAIVAVLSQADYEYIFGQMALNASVFLSLWLLSDRPLISPVQAVIFIFYWWFGIAPTVMGGFYLLMGGQADALQSQQAGMEALWIVAAGLPLYALAARQVLKWLEISGSYAGFLMPTGYLYRPRTLLTYWIVAIAAAVAAEAASQLGIGGITTVNYLGGQRVDDWWVGILNAVSDIAALAAAGTMMSFVAPRALSSRGVKLLGLVVIGLTLASAVTSGTKGQFVYIFFYMICALLSMRQVPPWRLILLVAVGFLFVVEPFVSFARTQAVMAGAQSVSDRRAIFLETIDQGSFTLLRDIQDVKIEALFRGIYPLAGELTRRNSWWDGYWHGLTIEHGLRALVPRALDPTKPDMDVGNFMARTVGVDLGQVDSSNYVTSVAVSLPFELVGNYGWLAGVATFPIIGLVWALVCGWLLSPARLSSHPLAPWLIGMALGMEAALGHYLASWRDVIIPLLVAYILWLILRKHL
jgi:hypothetical protein